MFTNHRGPVNSLGSLMDGSTVDPFDGPSIFWQGCAFPDPRVGWNKDSVSSGSVRGFAISTDVVMMDAIPMTAGTALLAAAQVATSGVAMVLATTALGGSADNVPSIASGIPLIPFGAATATTVTALDFGFTTGTTAANSSTVVVPDSSILRQAQWLIIGGAGAANATSLTTQVTAIVNATTINISPVAVAALTRAPIGQGNVFSQFPSGVTPNSISVSTLAGSARLYDPTQNLARCVSVTGNTTNAIGGFIVTGYDYHGVPMSELLTSSGTTTIFGQKAFKYILAVTSQTTNANSFTIGIGDTFGFPIRSDRWENITIIYNGGGASSAQGWLKAVTTSPATNTTGDIRGTVQVSSLGNGTSLATIGSSTNGVKRLFVLMSIPILSMVNATPSNYSSLFGVTQA